MTPLLLVTGFLGAGKTTFLRHILLDARQQNQNVAVIINEFGSADVDGALLRDAARDLATIAGGCACCAGQDDFLEAVGEMSGADYDWIVVEASGLADPVILLETLATSELRARVEVRQIICVADAANWNASAGALGPLLRRQLAVADTVVLNKTDLVNASALDALKAKLAHIAPNARIETAIEGRTQNALELRFRTPKMRSTELESAPHAASHTFWVALPHPLERAGLEAALGELNADVWRVKGFVRLRGQSGLQLVQLSGGDGGPRFGIAPFAPPFGADEPELGLVFIGAHLDEAALKAKFGALGLAF